MKRLIVTFPDDADIDLGALARVATDLKLETVGKPERRRVFKKPHRDPEVLAPDVIMSHFTPEGQFTTGTAAKWLAAAGFSPNGATSVLSALTRQGKLERLARGGPYRFVTKEPTR